MTKTTTKNCATCKYSTRDTTNLLLYCDIIGNGHHQMKIENTYQTAKNCYSYTPAWEKEEQTKNNIQQLTLKF